MTYLNIDPVKPEKEYAKPEASIYFNYKVWTKIYADKYGPIQIPTKCHVVPVVASNFFKDDYQEFLLAKYPDIYQKTISCLKDIGKKEISRIPLSPAMDRVPDEIIPLINAKSIVYKNCAPMYLALESLGFSTGINSNKKVLFVDLFGISQEEIYDEQNTRSIEGIGDIKEKEKENS